MLMLTGRVAGKLIKVIDQASRKNVELLGCVVVGGPSVRFQSFMTRSPSPTASSSMTAWKWKAPSGWPS